MEYKGWELLWTGWKPSREYSFYAGQWLAYRSDRDYRLYSSCPGGSGRYDSGQIFDLAVRTNQLIPELETSGEERDKASLSAKKLLMELIDQEA
jgi:hypothetical protein